MKNNKLFVIVLSLFIFFIVLSVSYYFASFIPQTGKKDTEQKQENIREVVKSVSDIQNCLNSVKEEKEETLEKLIKEESINLPVEYENIVKDYHQEVYNCYNKNS